MALQLPVIWKLHGLTTPGRVDVAGGRLELTSRGRAFGFPLGSVSAFMIERSPAHRLRGLPVLTLRLVGGDTITVASLGGPGSLRDLAAAVGQADGSST